MGTDRHTIDQFEMDELQGDCTQRANTFIAKSWIHRERERKNAKHRTNISVIDQPAE